MRNSLWQRVMAFLVAAVFLFAAEPGTMAMDMSAQSATPHSMAVPCHHGAAVSGQANRMGHAVMADCHHNTHSVPAPGPCKGMAVCLGLLGCYGLTALDAVTTPPRAMAADAVPVPFLAAGHGITHTPHNPPPIA